MKLCSFAEESRHTLVSPGANHRQLMWAATVERVSQRHNVHGESAETASSGLMTGWKEGLIPAIDCDFFLLGKCENMRLGEVVRNNSLVWHTGKGPDFWQVSSLHLLCKTLSFFLSLKAHLCCIFFLYEPWTWVRYRQHLASLALSSHLWQQQLEEFATLITAALTRLATGFKPWTKPNEGNT